MRRRRCQRLLKVLRWDIITLMALLEQLVLPAEDQSSFFFGLERVHVTGFSLSTFWWQQAGLLPLQDSIEFWVWSGPWCHEARNSSCDLNICRLAAVFLTALPTGAGLDAFTDMSGRHQLVVRLCYDEYDEVGLIHQYNTGCLQEALFPGMIRKRGSVNECGPGLIDQGAGGGGIFSQEIQIDQIQTGNTEEFLVENVQCYDVTESLCCVAEVRTEPNRQRYTLYSTTSISVGVLLFGRIQLAVCFAVSELKAGCSCGLLILRQTGFLLLQIVDSSTFSNKIWRY